MLTLLSLSLSLPVVDLERTSPDQADFLCGRPVLVRFLPGKPAYRWGGMTVAGAADSPDGIERTVLLRGDRLLAADRGPRMMVLARVETIRHPGNYVGGVVIPPWVELRASE